MLPCGPYQSALMGVPSAMNCGRLSFNRPESIMGPRSNRWKGAVEKNVGPCGTATARVWLLSLVHIERTTAMSSMHNHRRAATNR